jgi:hypothetical protein
MTKIPSTLARLLAGGCALALTLTACGGADDAADGGAPATTAPGDPTTVANGDAPATTTAEDTETDTDGTDTDDTDTDTDDGDDIDEGSQRWLSPLDEFLGFGVEPSAEVRAEDDQRQRQVEQLIAACMTAQGFEYVEVDWSAVAATAGPWDLPPDEFAQQYGYGITTIDHEDLASSDPNSAIVEAMSVAEKQAYYQALYGEMITVDANGELAKREVAADAAPPVDTESCSAQASSEVYGDAETATSDAQNDAFAPLQQEMSALYERVENDQRVVDARSTWSDCLAEAGYPGFADIYDPSMEISEQATALMGESMDPAAADPAALEELRTREIAMATADLACRVDYDAVHREVQVELEQQFIDDNRAELEQYSEAIAAGDIGVG